MLWFRVGGGMGVFSFFPPSVFVIFFSLIFLISPKKFFLVFSFEERRYDDQSGFLPSLIGSFHANVCFPFCSFLRRQLQFLGNYYGVELFREIGESER